MATIIPQQELSDALTTNLELRIACRKLKNKDTLSKSDPVTLVYQKNVSTGKFVEVGRTELIKNTVNPDFIKRIPIAYKFEEQQTLLFQVFDSDCDKHHYDHQDFLGRVECTLGEIVSTQGKQFERTLIGECHHCGNILISAEEVSACKDILILQFEATNLDKMDVMGKSDPYLVFYKCNKTDNSLTVVHKTEVKKKTLNPEWKQFALPVRTLCNGNLDQGIVVKCYDWDEDGGHDFIGEFQTTARVLMKGNCAENCYEVINSKKAKKSSYKNSGTCRVKSCKMDFEYSFLDYIKGGTQLHFTVAVDFTASNGNPVHSSSLHFQHPTQPNAYAGAIRAVGEVVQDYDADKMFPALGFGARIPPHGVVSHEFFLNGHPSNPYCAGIEGVLEAYRRSLATVRLYGPTNFSPVINHVARIAAANQTAGAAYFILLIITDGIVTDMADTKNAIAYASTLPVSIIIVGVGRSDFQAMEELDGDHMCSGSYKVNGLPRRDIVQFVPLRNILNTNLSWAENKALLAKEVLEEVPQQLTKYMRSLGLVPPTTATVGNFVSTADPRNYSGPSAPPETLF